MHFFFVASFYLATLALAAPKPPSKHTLAARDYETYDTEIAEAPDPESLCIPISSPYSAAY